MKATEIMIGDRLAYKGQYAAFDFRVEQVTKHKVGYHVEPGESRKYRKLPEGFRQKSGSLPEQSGGKNENNHS